MESRRVKLKDNDMYMVFTVTVDPDNPTNTTNWSTASFSLAEPVEALLKDCEHGYTVRDTHEIEFESVEDAVHFNLVYNG